MIQNYVPPRNQILPNIVLQIVGDRMSGTYSAATAAMSATTAPLMLILMVPAALDGVEVVLADVAAVAPPTVEVAAAVWRVTGTVNGP